MASRCAPAWRPSRWSASAWPASREWPRRVFSALASGGINILAIAQGSGAQHLRGRRRGRGRDAQRAIHAAFQLAKIGGGRRRRHEGTRCRAARLRPDRPELGGAGGRVAGGRAQGPDRRGDRPERLRLRRGRTLGPPDGGPRAGQGQGPLARRLPGGAAVEREAAGKSVTARAGRARSWSTPPPTTPRALLRALEGGMDVVLANKQPLAGPRQGSKSCSRPPRPSTDAGSATRRPWAPGLPVIDTFHKLIETGDRSRPHRGLPLGNARFPASRARAGEEVLAGARRRWTLGYTEPDPRDDLSGLDVARKALILGRLIGFAGELGARGPNRWCRPAQARCR